MNATELNSVLQGWLRLVGSYGVLVDPDEINMEALENMYMFLPSEGEEHDLTVASVAAFVRFAIDDRREWLLRHGGHVMRFYCWHDFQSRQLRLSLVSASHGRLPFGRVVEETGDLQRVIREIVDFDWLNETHMQAPESSHEDSEELPRPLLVYVQVLP